MTRTPDGSTSLSKSSRDVRIQAGVASFIGDKGNSLTSRASVTVLLLGTLSLGDQARLETPCPAMSLVYVVDRPPGVLRLLLRRCPFTIPTEK